MGTKSDESQTARSVLDPLELPSLRPSGGLKGLAMAKVEGSNPFIRFIESPGDPGLSCVLDLANSRANAIRVVRASVCAAAARQTGDRWRAGYV
jgi:hypothetical protein